MRKKRKKRKKIGKIRIVLLGVLIYILAIMLNQNKMMNELEGKRLALTKEINYLEEEIDDINKELENSDSLEFVEKIARDELGMVKPREIIVIDEDKPKSSFFDFFRSDSNWHIALSDIYWDWKYY